MAGKSFLCGVHLSIAGGITNVFAEAERLGINCFQLFLGSPRVWQMKEPAESECARFREQAAAYPFINCHAPYLINFATDKPELYDRSVRRAVSDMRCLEKLGIKYYVVHPGTSPDIRRGIDRIREALRLLLTATACCSVLIENTAGEKNDIAKNMDEIAAITDGCGARVGICLDTCHLYASGIDVRTGTGIADFYTQLKKAGLDEKVAMIHANDSKADLGGMRDRHTHIGEGTIGDEGFRNLLAHPFFGSLPFILETPKEDDMDPVNLKRLQKLRNE